MTIDEYKFYLLSEIAALRQQQPSPSAFATATELLDALAQASTSPRRHGQPKGNGTRFREFIRRYMGPRYTSFLYASGKQDLPEQMYAILRCGLVHTRSLTPTPALNGKPSDGRENSILIAGDGVHLAPVTAAPYDAALFVFDPFIADIEAALRRVFRNALRESGLRALLERHIRDHRPARGLPVPIPYIDLAALSGTTFTHSASGCF